MITELTQQQRTRWRELLSKQETIRQVLSYTEENTPVAFNPNNKIAQDKDSVAMTSAYAEGWRNCLKFITRHCAEEIISPLQTNFQDMSDSSEKSH